MEWESDYSYEPRPQFEQVFVCLPFSKYRTSSHQEIGNKIIIPQSSLSQIVCAGIQFPLFFKIRNFNNDDISHCGVSLGDTVSLIDTDCIVDFAPALDYKEEVVKKKDSDKKKFRAFTGKSRRLDGEEAAESRGGVAAAAVVEELPENGIQQRKKDGGKEEVENKKFKAFTGMSCVLGSIEF